MSDVTVPLRLKPQSNTKPTFVQLTIPESRLDFHQVCLAVSGLISPYLAILGLTLHKFSEAPIYPGGERQYCSQGI
jgi:hypothetical protein